MSGAKEVASTAIDNIESLIAEMLSGGHQDNAVSLGRVRCGQDTIQIQLHITKQRAAFLDSDEWDDDE